MKFDDQPTIQRCIFKFCAATVGMSAISAFAQEDQSAFTQDPLARVIEEVIVTAQHRPQPVQDVPIAVTAISGETLQNQDLFELSEVARLTPGFTSSSFSQSEPIFAIRGASNTFSQAGASKPVGVFLDDVYISRNTASAFELYDLEQIAIARGPQGTLFGRNVTGGAVMLNTSRPSMEETEVRFEVGAGNYNSIDLRALASGPLGDAVAGKLSTTVRSADGYGEDRLVDREQNDLDTKNIRAQLLTQSAESFQALFSLDYSEDNNNGRTLSAVLPENADDGDIRTSEHGVAQEYSRETTGAAMHLDWDTGIGDFKSITAFRDGESADFYSFSSTSFTLLPSFNPFFPFQQVARWNEQPTTLSQEFRFVSKPGGKIDYVAGLYFFDDEVARQTTTLRLAGQTGNTTRDHEFDERVENESTAAYANVDVHLTEALTLTLGGRYTYEEKAVQVDFSDGLNNDNSFNSPEFSESWSEFTPRVVANWSMSEDASLYASYTEGFTSGGFNTQGSSADVIGQAFDPETIQSVELGVKTLWADQRVSVNATVFQQNYQDKQEGFLNTNFNFVIVNASEATMEGIEVELAWAVTDGLSLYGSYAYLDASYDDFIIPGIEEDDDRSGNLLANSPENSGALGAEYRHKKAWGSLIFNANATWQDDYFTGSENRDTFLIEGYSLINANIGYETADGHWQITLWGKNLSDEDYVLIRSDFGDVIGVGESYGSPMTYGVKLTGKF